MTAITEKEALLLTTIRDSQYHDGQNPVDNPVWTENPFENQRTAAGVMASLVKKGLADSDYDDWAHQDSCFWITAEGVEALRQYRAET